MVKDSKELKDLKKQRKDLIIEFFEFLFCLIFFPIFGIVIISLWIGDTISNLYKLHKEIKEQKIKDILSNVVVIKDENGYVKDIKL